jgi:uncharacterized membrane protein
MLFYIVIVGAAINLLGGLYYVKDTLSGKAKPNRVSWLMWSIAPLIATAASLVAGVTWAVLPTFMAGFIPLLVLITSFASKDAYWKLERFDYFCGLFSLLALILWAVTKNPSIAIIFAIVADALAAMPTVVKGWKHPETESKSAYIGGLISALTAFVVITTWTFPEYAFPTYLVFIDIILLVPLYRKRASKIAKK